LRKTNQYEQDVHVTHPLHIETLAIHAGQEPDPTTGAVMMPIYQTSTYVQSGVGDTKAMTMRAPAIPRAPRSKPVWRRWKARSMACVLPRAWRRSMLLRLIKPGQHVLAGNDVYGGTYRLFVRVLSDYGLHFDFVDMSDLDCVRAAIQPNTRLIWIETPTNPLLQIADVAALAEIAHAAGAQLGVDNTFASPYLQQPIGLGADFVIHSTTKYIGGHSDVIGGAIVTNDTNAYERLKFLQNAIGAVPGPLDCFLTLRGLKTLPLRMERHSANAQRIAEFLADHPAVKHVMYPGLEDHPQHGVAKKQMRHYGGMISFLPVGDAATAKRSNTRRSALANHWAVESLIELPG
jgi:cystathionine beta-lyase/cystathionine gamma-synthase